MITLQDDNQPVEKADKILISRYEVRRSPNGVGDSNLLVDLGYGKLTGDTDSYGNPTMNVFTEATMLNVQFSLLVEALQQAVVEERVTSEQVEAQVAALLALDAANQEGLEAFVTFCQTAGLLQLPTRVVR